MTTSDGFEKLTVTQQCEVITKRVHTRIQDARDPAGFPDWHSCIRDRDDTIRELSVAVGALCAIVMELDSK